jgi:hypothetical protein
MADGYALLAQQGLWDGFVPEPSREDDACGDPIRGAIWSLSRQGVDERSVISTAHLIVDWEAGKDRGWRIGEQRDQEPLLDWLQAQAANPELAPDLRVRAAHALMSAGLDTGEAIERCWAARDSLGPEGSALLAVCLASKRPRDSALLLERAVSMTDLDPDSSFATFYSWEKNRPERWGRILAGAEVLEALAMLRPEHPMAAPLANSLILQCSAQRWVQNALIGDALAAIVAYAAAGGPYAISASKAGTDGITNPNSIPSDLIARLPQGALQLTRSFALRSSSTQRPVAGTSREPTFTWDGLDIGSAGDQVGFHCQVGDTLEITLSLVSPIALTDISINDPLAAGCGTIPPPLFGWGRGRQMQETWEESAVVLALPQVQTGETELTHRLVADRPGEFQVPPAQATLMSFPEVVAFSEPMVLLIAPR